MSLRLCRALLACALLVTGGPGLAVAAAASGASSVARAPGKAGKAKRRPSSSRPRTPKKPANPGEAEVNLNDDRKRVFKRLRVVNQELKDGVLAATVGKLERKEAIRHELALLLLTLEDRRVEAEKKGEGR